MHSIIFIFFLSLQVFAQSDRRTATPLRTIREVHYGSRAEEVVQLGKARVAILDYDLLRLDFPILKELSNDQIDQWILNEVAYISKPQASQTVVNSEIDLSGEKRVAKRPPEYGRAIVFEVKNPQNGEQIGLIDAKGTGSLNPHNGSHGNGLATLGECIREYNYENVVREVLTEADLPNKTVGSYGVIDAGFDVIHADGSKSRAGIYLRQSHNRPTYNGWLNSTQREKLQKVMHKYGIDPGGNIQGTKGGDIYDFGHFVVKDDLANLDPQRQIPFSHWGYDKSIPLPSTGDTRWFYSKLDKPWIWAHETAEAFAKGTADRDSIFRHYQDMVGPVKEKLKNCNVYLRSPI